MHAKSLSSSLDRLMPWNGSMSKRAFVSASSMYLGTEVFLLPVVFLLWLLTRQHGSEERQERPLECKKMDPNFFSVLKTGLGTYRLNIAPPLGQETKIFFDDRAGS